MKKIKREFDQALSDVFGIDSASKDFMRKGLPVNIRYELGGSGTYTEMFFQALFRAKTIYEFVFGDGDVYVDLVYYNKNKKYSWKPYKYLESCGLKFDDKPDLLIVKEEESDEIMYRHHYSFKAQGYNSNIHALLWTVCASDMGVEPPYRKVGSRELWPDVFFVSFDKKIIFHPYDDRGADLFSTNKKSLMRTYKKFYDWILDYDLKRIQKIFT